MDGQWFLDYGEIEAIGLVPENIYCISSEPGNARYNSTLSGNNREIRMMLTYNVLYNESYVSVNTS